MANTKGKLSPRAVASLANAARKHVPKSRTIQHNSPEGDSRERPPVILRTYAVCWGIPFDEVVFSKWASNLLLARMMPWDSFISVQNTYLAKARNTVHDQFLNDVADSVEWLVMLDSDVAPPPDFIDRLVRSAKRVNAKMIGGWYRMKSDPYAPVVYNLSGTKDKDGVPLYRMWGLNEIPKDKGVHAVGGAGAGCWLMHRSLAEKLGESPYDLHHGGEDLLICRKVQDAGEKCYIDFSVACAHIGVGVA